ncbi:Protein pns1 like [Actinidia chinensis var. chinensis]|uniref:Choline transporter-like protein n=1 Tax=Actinidia chinensis var. chinensis TaxID=1590841 RepID=A0A2R6QVN4_ACTCC|nr:Protein pns1 like [Actinidia chinensis var. chinensis]
MLVEQELGNYWIQNLSLSHSLSPITMDRFNDSNAPQVIQLQQHDQTTHRQENRIPSTYPFKVQEPNSPRFSPPPTSLFLRNLSRNLFYLHFSLITILLTALTIRSLISAHHPLSLSPPLLASIACSAATALLFHFLTLHNPSRALRAAFWLSPLLTCAVGILLVSVGSAASLAVATTALVSAVAQSLYSCWVSTRFDHAAQVLSAAMSPPPTKSAALVVLTVAACTVYSGFVAVGICGATVAGGGLEAVFVLVILVSLAWTMHVIRNVVQVAESRVKYMSFACGMDLETSVAFLDAIKDSLGSVCVGSVLVPVLGLVRGSARAIRSVSGDIDEFMFSCANCYSGVASRLITYGNRWGFVHVGVYNKGFVQASTDTWEMFRRVGLEPVIDSDLTSSFCFLCGVASGGVSALVGGSWALAVHNGYATAISIYAFLIGYFMCRVAMAWPQACVSAYHVAYAENPQSHRFDPTIPVRIEELHRSRAQPSRPTHTTEF